MLSSIRLRAFRSAPLQLRSLATHASDLPSTSSRPATPSRTTPAAKTTTTQADGALRPHLNIPVDPNHGLWGFFRRQEKDGKVWHETIEIQLTGSGRSWTAPELRRKSFKDLHTLWYVLLRERNLLATQAEESRRLRIISNRSASMKACQVRKSMARIKYVINERRLQYERAAKIYEDEELKAIQAAQADMEVKETEATQIEQEAKAAHREKASEAQSAAILAGAGLFETLKESAAPTGNKAQGS